MDGEGYEIVPLGQYGETRIEPDRLQVCLERAQQAEVRALLANAMHLASWLVDAEVNSGESLRLRHLAGIRLDTDYRGNIYAAMLSYKRFSDAIFAVHGV